MLEFEFERKGTRYTVHSESYINVPPPGVYQVLTDYEQLHRISNIVVESRRLKPGPDGEILVYTLNTGCLAFFCRSVEKIERLETTEPTNIVTTVVPSKSDIAFGRSEWQLRSEGIGTRLTYRMETETNFWVPPLIGNFMLERWLRSGASEALTRIEYYAWHALYGDEAKQSEPEIPVPQ